MYIWMMRTYFAGGRRKDRRQTMSLRGETKGIDLEEKTVTHARHVGVGQRVAYLSLALRIIRLRHVHSAFEVFSATNSVCVVFRTRD